MDSATAEPGGQGRPSARWLLPVLACALVLALVALGLVLREWDQARDRGDDVGHALEVVSDPADEAEAAARDAAVKMTTYDYRSLEKDFAWVERIGTDRFRKDFTLASKPVKRVIRATRTQAQGEVMASAARLEDETEATVVLFVDQLLVDRSSSRPKLDTIRLVIELVQEDDRWLVDQVESFEPQAPR